MQILAIFNAKGGVAKTTTAVNLAACLTAMGRRVLVVDLDYQGNSTTSLGFAQLPRYGSYDLITGRRGLTEVRHDTFMPGLSVIGATGNLAAVDVELALKDASHDLLRRLLEPADVDLVILDCPPAMGVMTLNALVSCTACLLPSPAEPYAHDGLLRTWSVVSRIRGELNTGLKMLGILPTLMAPKEAEALARAADTPPAPNALPDAPTDAEAPPPTILDAMRAEFGTRVALTAVPRDDTLFPAAAAHGVPACVFAPDAAASRAYLRIAAQIHGPDGSLRCLDDAAPDAADLRTTGRGTLARFHRRAADAGLLDRAINVPEVSPVDEAAIAAAAQPSAPPSRLPWILGIIGAGLLGGVIGYSLGWVGALP